MDRPKIRFKQTLRINDNVTAIMRLPCVFSCHKESDERLCYLLYDWDDNGKYIEARKGDWLCEDEDGKWSVLTNGEYEKYREEWLKMQRQKRIRP